MVDYNRTNHDSQREVGRPISYDTNLPSTEFRDAIPEWEGEEIHLRDYLEVVIRRKWLIISILFLVFISALIYSLSATKLYKASVSIEVEPAEQKITKFEEVAASQLHSKEFYQTQIDLLGDKALAIRVIDRLELEKHPLMADKPGDEEEKSDIVSSIKEAITSFFAKNQQQETQVPLIAEETLKQQGLINFVHSNLDVSPKRNSMIIDLSFSSPDRHLSQTMVNTIAEEFIHWQMDKKLDASQMARDFLMKQIDRAKINLEKAEEELNRFAKQAGIVSLDSKLNIVYRQLEELNSAQASAIAELIRKEAVYLQAMIDGASTLPQVLESSMISNLKATYAQLRSEYEDLTVTFRDEYPEVKALKMRMDSINERIQNEEAKIFSAIKNDYEAALKKANAMQERVISQKQSAMALNERATQYKIMEREVETNKHIYQSLLQRVKEIESMVGVSSGNIHIVGPASLPILPFKPNVKRNMMLAIVIGLVLGIGGAFFLEYFTDTINNPDEISDRFQIPILGVAPLEKNLTYPIEKSFVSNPRSPFSEALRTTKVSIQLSGTDPHPKSILFTSTIPGEGKTTLAMNLGQTFAAAGEKVILIDADLRKPQLRQLLIKKKNTNHCGLSTFLAGLDGKKGYIFHTGIRNLHLMPSGPIPPNPVELLASNRFAKLIRYLGDHYDRVILDGPPHQGFADTLVLSQHIGGIILVSSMGDTTRGALRLFKKNMGNVHGTILGCIINKVSKAKGYGYHSYYKYYSYYNYKYAENKKMRPKRHLSIRGS
jgi:polysaccharide biosynthesis transport protein